MVLLREGEVAMLLYRMALMHRPIVDVVTWERWEIGEPFSRRCRGGGQIRKGSVPPAQIMEKMTRIRGDRGKAPLARSTRTDSVWAWL